MVASRRTASSTSLSDGREQKNRFKHIFVDGWADFKRAHPQYESVDEVVQKMLGCGEPANGYAVYLCPNCQHRHIVAFSCKSQFCLSCAKAYSQQWVATVQEMLHPGVTYRHLTLTIPEALRALFYQHPAALLDGLMQVAHTTMDAVVAQVKRQTIKLGYIVVLQTAVAEMRRRYPKGFVAYLQGDVRPRMTQLARYLAKYVVSPPMALSRIIAYDQECGTVTYWYRDHQRGGQRTEETVSRETFIGRMVQHILPKGFQRIRYYGLQATCILKQVRDRLLTILQVAVQQAMEVLGAPIRRWSYRVRLRATLGRDPLICRRCGSELWLWQVWHPHYGVVYDELERMKAGVYERVERPICRRVDSDRARDAGVGSDGYLQLPLFALPA